MKGSLILAVACAAAIAPPASGQNPPPRAPGAPPAVARPVFDSATTTIPYFPLGESPLALHGPARPGMFVSSVGRRAIAMGTEDGRLELWSWPIKWLHDFELSFRVPKYSEPIAGRAIAQSVTERPEGITIEYAYEQFTVREHIFVPLDKPATIILLEVDAIRPLDILARFTPDIHFAWPAALGGQYLVWEQNARAFLFSEAKRSINAFLGSPAVTEASDVPAHMLSAAPPQLVLGVGSGTERYTAPRLGEPPGHDINVHISYIPIVLAGGQMSRDSALALYRELIAPGAAEREWKRRVAHADSMRTTMFALHSPDPSLDRAVEYAKVNLDESFVCNPDLGCGLVAGYGLSGSASDRPGFGWFFGGDASINSFAMSGVGQSAHVRDGVMRFFAKYQRADGKITHEISQGAGHVDWFSYPYPYYHGDTTPFWILAFGEYWRQTGDSALLRELWPNLKRAYAWSLATDKNGDGLMENPSAGAGALEVGDLQIGILSDIYLSGVWAAALDRFARMAETSGEPTLAAEARQVRAKALATIESKLWMPSLGQYAFALLQDGSVNPNLTAWAATAMAFGVLDHEHGAEMAAKLASSTILTDWGARPLSSASPLFDPLHYNNGAVWPFVTGFVSLAEYEYHNAAAGRFALDAIARTGVDHSLGRNPEVLSGRLYKPLDTAVPQQFFATSMVLTPLIRGLLGIEVDAPRHRVTIAPHLPPDWDSVAVDNVPVGTERISFVVRRGNGRIALALRRAGGDRAPIDVEFSPALPLGARVSTSRAETRRTPGDVHASVRASLPMTGAEGVELAVSYDGGWSIVPPAMALAVGARSSAPRVLSERLGDAGAYSVALEGLAGRSYAFRITAPDERGAGRLDVRVGNGAAAAFGPTTKGEATRLVTITFPSAGANSDGYTAATATFSTVPNRSAPMTSSITRAPFGVLPSGDSVHVFTLANANGVELRALDYGAIVVSLRTPDRNGTLGDIVLGFDTLDGYVKSSPYFGALAGRYANRIAKGQFTLDGATYHLAINNGPNSLHGGLRGFDKVVWRAEPRQDASGAAIVFHYTSKDGEEGYPGTLNVQVRYTLTDRNELIIDYAATTDKATPVNLTQHSYFNLAGDGSGDVLGHIVTFDADRFIPIDTTLIPTGAMSPVAGTPFDLRKGARIGAHIDEPNGQLKNAHGYDHTFVINRSGPGLVHAARAVEPVSGRTLDVATTEPGVQFYTGNFLDGTFAGKGGRVYGRRGAFCLETQHFPDSPNQPSFPSTILRPGAEYRSRTVYTFGVAK